ncbi:MAG: DUF58 domain-containing protein [Candidatus Nanoarchaeia archaeon]
MKEIVKQVKKVELNTKKLVEGLITGNYHSIFKGPGIEFSEIREYKLGDDIRAIDWKVTARFNKPFVKEFIEERDLSVYFVLDISGSSSFGNNIEKKRKSIELIASLMFSAMKNNDAVGLFLITDKLDKFVPARKGKKHILRLIMELLTFNPKSKKTNLLESFKSVSKIIKKRSIVFVISDFFSEDFSKPLKVLKKRNDVIAVRIIDNREKELPNIGYIELEDEETGEQVLVDTSEKEFRENYAKLVKENDKKLEKIFKKYKIDFIEILTDESYEKPLKKFFKIRKFREVR